MKKIASILVAIDLTEASDVVLHAAAALAKLSDAKLHVLHAFDFRTVLAPPAMWGPSQAGTPQE